ADRDPPTVGASRGPCPAEGCTVSGPVLGRSGARIPLVMTIWNQLEPLLGKVQKPARYIGCEDGAQSPEHHPQAAAWLLGYPDTYEIGLPNQGLQILREIINEHPAGLAERTYAPWTDLEELMRANGVPLFSVDSHRPASDFDIMAFN